MSIQKRNAISSRCHKSRDLKGRATEPVNIVNHCSFRRPTFKAAAPELA
jgi:hypothetical protein